MANNIHVRSYLLFALLVFLVVFRSVVVVSDQPSVISNQLSVVSFQSPAVVRDIRYQALGDRANDLGGSLCETFDLRSLGWPCVSEDSASLKKRDAGYKKNSPSSTVILSGVKRSRKISALTAGRIRPEEENLIRNKIKQIYSAEIGVREATGKNDGERVEEYLALTNLGKGYAWCASFISWVFSEAGFPEPRTPWSPALFPKERVIWERGRQLSATSNQPNDLRNFVGFVGGEISSVLKVSTSTHVLKPNASHLTPRAGDIFGIYFNNLKRIAHAGFVDEWGSTFIITVEGNTNETGSAEGDGVYRRRRPIGSLHSVANWIDRPKDGQN